MTDESRRFEMISNPDALTGDELGAFNSYALRPDISTILGYLGISVQRTERGHSALTYPEPEEIAHRIVDLNKLLPPQRKLIQIEPYDGDRISAESYVRTVANDRFPITTGKPGVRTSFFKSFARRPHMELQGHDIGVHLIPQLLSTPRIRAKRAEYLKNVLTSPRRRDIVAMGRNHVQHAAHLIEQYWQIQLPDYPNPTTPIPALMAYGLREMRKCDGGPRLGDAEIASMIDEIPRTTAFVARVIRANFALAA